MPQKIAIFLFFILSLFLNSCQSIAPNSAFSDVDKLTIERIYPNGQRELIMEIADVNEIQKIVDFIDYDADAEIECSFQLKLSFQKFEGKNIEAFTNLNGDCNNIAFTFKSQFYSKPLSSEGVNYLRLMTGI